MYIIGIDPTKFYDDSADEVPEFGLGNLGVDDDGKIYQFVRANGAITLGDVVVIDESGDADQVGTTESAAGTGQGLPVGVALVTVADNDWCWVQRYGVTAAVNAATGCAAHTEVNTTGTPGRVDDGASGAEVVAGLTITATAADNTAPGILNWPFIGRVLA